jgi:hypothetical protein
MAGDLGVLARVRACWSTTGRGESKAHRGSHNAARVNGRARKQFSELMRWAREVESERSTRARETNADRAAPPGRGREGEGVG